MTGGLLILSPRTLSTQHAELDVKRFWCWFIWGCKSGVENVLASKTETTITWRYYWPYRSPRFAHFWFNKTSVRMYVTPFTLLDKNRNRQQQGRRVASNQLFMRCACACSRPTMGECRSPCIENSAAVMATQVSQVVLLLSSPVERHLLSCHLLLSATSHPMCDEVSHAARVKPVVVLQVQGW